MTPQQNLRRTVSFAFAALAIAAVATATSGKAKGVYDGTWSVSIVTEKGDCDRGYRYPIAINDGVLKNAGTADFDISGKVAANGAITVRVAHGDKSAMGTGQLSGTYGEGLWKGGTCAGSWTAERRG